MSKHSTSKAGRVYAPVDEVLNVMGCAPADITSTIQRASGAFDWLDEIFQAIDQAAKGGNLDRVRRLVSMGRYLAQDYADFTDCARSNMLEALLAVGVDVCDE